MLFRSGSIGDTVFLDNDGSNTQSTGDSPVVGVKVYLLNSTGVKIDSTTTGTDPTIDSNAGVNGVSASVNFHTYNWTVACALGITSIVI